MGAERVDGAVVDDVDEKHSAVTARDTFVECGKVERCVTPRDRNIPQKRCFDRQGQDDKKLPFDRPSRKEIYAENRADTPLLHTADGSFYAGRNCVIKLMSRIAIGRCHRGPLVGPLPKHGRGEAGRRRQLDTVGVHLAHGQRA